MAKTKVIIIYSSKQGILRKVIIPDDDSQIPNYIANIKTGEQVMIASLTDYLWNYGPNNLLARFLGRKSTTDRCAVINAAGYVVAIVRADSAIDYHKSGRLHCDPNKTAVVGQLARNLSLLP